MCSYEYLPLIDFSMPSLLLFVLILPPRLFMGVFECNFLEFFVNLSLDASNERTAVARDRSQLYSFFMSFVRAYLFKEDDNEI